MRRWLRQSWQDWRHVRCGVPRLAVRPTDGFVTSWPRSGNTWMRYMLFYAIHPHEQWDLLSIEEQMPIVDRMDFKQALHRVGDPPVRLFKSHELFQSYLLNGRTVYIVRDGRDATASFFDYRTKLGQRDIPWRQYLRRSLAGEFRYGSWHAHVGGWLAHDAHPSMLVVRYEDMLADPAGQLRRALDHLGLAADDKQVAAAVERSSVGQVNKGFAKYAQQKQRQFAGGLGGGSGKHKTLFSDEDEALFMQHAGELMRRLGYAT